MTRENGGTPHQWSGGTRGGRWGNRFFLWLVRHGGLSVTPFFVFWVSSYFLVAWPAARRASMDLARRLGVAAGWRRWWFARRHFATFGTLLVDRMAILGGQAERYEFECIGEERIVEAARAGRGVVLLTAHLGAWEIMGQMLEGIDAPTCLVMAGAVDAGTRRVLDELSSGRSFRVLYTDGSPASVAGVLAALRNGEIIGLGADRVVAGGALTAPLLGADARWPAGPYALAAAAGAPVLSVFSVRTGPRRYRFRSYPVALAQATSRRERRNDAQRQVTAFATLVDEHLRAWPHQWGNFYDFWAEAEA